MGLYVGYYNDLKTYLPYHIFTASLIPIANAEYYLKNTSKLIRLSVIVLVSDVFAMMLSMGALMSELDASFLRLT